MTLAKYIKLNHVTYTNPNSTTPQTRPGSLKILSQDFSSDVKKPAQSLIHAPPSRAYVGACSVEPSVEFQRGQCSFEGETLVATCQAFICEWFWLIGDSSIPVEEELSRFLEVISLWFPPRFFSQTRLPLHRRQQIWNTRVVARVAPANARKAIPQRNLSPEVFNDDRGKQLYHGSPIFTMDSLVPRLS